MSSTNCSNCSLVRVSLYAFNLALRAVSFSSASVFDGVAVTYTAWLLFNIYIFIKNHF